MSRAVLDLPRGILATRRRTVLDVSILPNTERSVLLVSIRRSLLTNLTQSKEAQSSARTRSLKTRTSKRHVLHNIQAPFSYVSFEWSLINALCVDHCLRRLLRFFALPELVPFNYEANSMLAQRLASGAPRSTPAGINRFAHPGFS